jgi:hypothetical protein
MVQVLLGPTVQSQLAQTSSTHGPRLSGYHLAR